MADNRQTELAVAEKESSRTESEQPDKRSSAEPDVSFLTTVLNEYNNVQAVCLIHWWLNHNTYTLWYMSRHLKKYNANLLRVSEVYTLRQVKLTLSYITI